MNRSKGEPLLRKWLLILIGRMWDGYPAAVEHANRGNYIQNILDFVKEDEDPEVRVNTIYKNIQKFQFFKDTLIY